MGAQLLAIGRAHTVFAMALYDHILVATDLSEASAAAVDAAIALTETFHARLSVVTTASTSPLHP